MISSAATPRETPYPLKVLLRFMLLDGTHEKIEGLLANIT